LIETVAFTAEVPFTLAHTIWLILKTRPEDAALDNKVLAVVLLGVRYVVLPVRVVTLTIFGFAMMVPYRPNTIEKAIASIRHAHQRRPSQKNTILGRLS
jgi:hypothetical protein